MEALEISVANKKAGLEHIQRQWNWLIEQEKLPISKQFSFNNEIPSDVYMEGDDLFWELSFQNDPLIDEHIASLQINAREVVWETAVAVRAFELEQGRNPQKLNDLVPRYLQKIEDDPFDTSRQLRYSPHSKAYTQWFKGKAIYTKKLPLDSVAEVLPPFVPGAVQSPRATGYRLVRKNQNLKFLLYSVGRNEHDDGGMDFKEISTRPTTTGVISLGGNDDILAGVELFQIPTLSQLTPVSFGLSPA